MNITCGCKKKHSVTKTEISVFGRQALGAKRRRSPSLAVKVLKCSKIFRSMMGAFRCNHTRYPSRRRGRISSDWVIEQPVRKNRLENRTSFFTRFSRFRDIRATCHTLRLTRVQGNWQAPYGRIVSCSSAFSSIRGCLD